MARTPLITAVITIVYMSNQTKVPSPTATGGDGTFFEQHVNAFFLALMLVRGLPPILKDCQLEKIHFQARHLDWNTDDFVLIGTRSTGEQRHLVTQVKRSFTIGKNEECQKTFEGFWKDFKNTQNFNPDKDRLALITLRGTDTLLDKFNSLLDCARASENGADFIRRLAPFGYLSTPALTQAETIKKIIQQLEGNEPNNDDYRRFLSVLHVVSFDLNTSTAQNEAWVKTLLAHSCQELDPIASAEATWRELLELVGKGMPTATTYTRAKLPKALLSRHQPVTSSSLLGTLLAHSQTTLDGISTTIRHTESIKRDSLVNHVLESLDHNKVVVLTGPAGFGKSALAKATLELLHEQFFCLAFRVEEFATPHVDAVLQQIQVGLNKERLLALLAAQGRKIILVESVERLLEASVRDAFSDLLRLARQDNSIQFLLTCRDYSVETVRSSLLEPIGLPHGVLEVPPLTDAELSQIAERLPFLQGIFTNNHLKALLHSPYLLNMAAQMDWSEAQTSPTNERTFRAKYWAEIVRRDAVASDGMPRRREQVFLELAKRRACELRPHVPCNDMDAGALEALRKDGLVVLSQEASNLAAPAHDVLEDWAIMQWLNERFLCHEEEATLLANDIGGYPAIRRAYRKWLGEMLECDTQRADAFILSCFNDQSIHAYFRDDTLISTLQFLYAPEFLTRQRASLLANQGALLIRVIHLLRVACKALPYWIPGTKSVPSELLVPKGSAWPAVLNIVKDGLEQLLPAQVGLLVGLLEDWSKLVAWNQPDLPGFHDAGKIIFALLPHLEDYEMNKLRKQVLTIISKIPRADATAFKKFMDRCYAKNEDDNITRDFTEILLFGLNSTFACRDFPDEVINLSNAAFCLSEEQFLNERDYHYSMEIGSVFGLHEHIGNNFFPPSAIRGPFLPLLRYHPKNGLKYIIELLNHSSRWYGEKLWPENKLDFPWQITLNIPGENPVVQWANSMLWLIYRGLSVSSYMLQCALMALESWLLELCESTNLDIAPILLRLLQESNNVAVTAVVASICNAYPKKSGKAALALLTSPDLFKLDRERFIQDHNRSSRFTGFPSHDVYAQFYEEERKKSAALPHRQDDLEKLALKLQLSGQQEQVWEILDRHRATLPLLEEQSEEHRLWRLALHRMDMRGFRPVESPPNSKSKPPTEIEQQVVYFGPGEIEEDVQELINRDAPERTRHEVDMGLWAWGKSAWERDGESKIDITAWQAKLTEAQKRDSEPDEPAFYAYGGPGFIAAVCVRDHWEEMSTEDREWCVAKLINEIKSDCDADNLMMREACGFMYPNRAAAYVLPKLLSQTSSKSPDTKLRQAIAKALTHPVSEVVGSAAEGIGYYLQENWENLVIQCVGAIAKQANLLAIYKRVEQAKSRQERLNSRSLLRRLAPEVCAWFETENLHTEIELAKLDLSWQADTRTLRIILQILAYHPDLSLAHTFHRNILEYLIECRTREEQVQEDDTYSYIYLNQRDYEFEYECFRYVARFLLKLDSYKALMVSAPILSEVNENPTEVAEFIEKLIIAEDYSEGSTPFWEIWQSFADHLCSTSWIDNVDSRYSKGKNLLSKLFLGIRWKENIRHWQRLEGHSHRIDELAKRLPASSTTLHAYSRFLHDIGEQSLPNGFIIIADLLEPVDNKTAMLAHVNTIFYLESLLRRYVYGEPLKLKQTKKLRNSVLQILDALVEAGSSAAFHMRDDFVTPIDGNTPLAITGKTGASPDKRQKYPS